MNKKQILNFAEHCMIKLLTDYSTEIPEISSYDLYMIHKILNEFKDDVNYEQEGNS